jgi:Secretion system C-terminal sorting domain
MPDTPAGSLMHMTVPGDIILTAEYSSSSITAVEARIWIDRADLLITPAGFNWTGSFDGANTGSQYGYAGIQPKAAGTFYTGLQSVNNTWAGPFSLVLGDNSVVPNYTARQFMEFSVNLSKLGLDQAQIFGGDDCQMPFRRVVVKTRASTSFTAELKDFIAPFDFFMAPAAQVESMTPMICDTGSVSNIYVMNPIPTSIYQWSTLNGNIVGSTTGPSIIVDTPGVYIVNQYLSASCSVYATDTITIGSFGICSVLASNLVDFRSTLSGDNNVHLSWKVLENQLTRYFDIERSVDGVNFSRIKRIDAALERTGNLMYYYTDNINILTTGMIYYRIRVSQTGNKELISQVTRHQLGSFTDHGIRISPNPVRNSMQVTINSSFDGRATILIYDQVGKVVSSSTVAVQKGNNVFSLASLSGKQDGVYQVVISAGEKVYKERILLMK